jgi:hypothetical protein
MAFEIALAGAEIRKQRGGTYGWQVSELSFASGEQHPKRKTLICLADGDLRDPQQ